MFWFGLMGGVGIFSLVLASNLFLRKSVNSEEASYKDLDAVYNKFDMIDFKEQEIEEIDEPLNLNIRS